MKDDLSINVDEHYRWLLKLGYVYSKQFQVWLPKDHHKVLMKAIDAAHSSTLTPSIMAALPHYLREHVMRSVIKR